MSILFTEYNEEAARRVYGEELLEEATLKMLKKGYPISDISEISGLSEEQIMYLIKKENIVYNTAVLS